MQAERIVEIALAEVGYLEKASNASLDSKTANAGTRNYNKYARDIWPALQAQPWCDIFVSWCGIQAGAGDAVGKFAYCPSHVAFFRNRGQYFDRGAKTPRAGDIIFFGDADHVGIVEYASGGYVHTIEGNASGSTGLTPNGGAVVRKRYPLSSAYIMGYGRPDYGDVDHESTASGAREEGFDVAKTYKNGSTDEPVFADTALTIRVGSLNPYESCDCMGVVAGRYLVKYRVDGTADTYKAGFVAYSGGVT